MYKNPTNYKELEQSLLTLPTLHDVFNLVQNTFPNWIRHLLKNYSTDYSYLQANWAYACNELEHKPKTGCIILVDYIGQTDEYSFIQNITELFTSAGYIVRTTDELLPCKYCGRAIPSQDQHKIMLEKGLEVPEKWADLCSGCVASYKKEV